MQRLIGSYEVELHPTIEAWIRAGYDTVIDVGCAEGYYAVGFALRLPDARIFAFDIDPLAQSLCAEMAQRNEVADRVHVSGICRTVDLQRLIADRTLILSDCEGFELELLDPAQAPNLIYADMIVEMHDFVDPTISVMLRDRFARSHDIEIIDARLRDPFDYPIVKPLAPHFQSIALDERRPSHPRPMQWAVLRSLAAVTRESLTTGCPLQDATA